MGRAATTAATELAMPLPPTIHLSAAFAKIRERWSPKILSALNSQHVKAAKIEGEFVWHSHPDSDELFFIHKGSMRMDYRDGHADLVAGVIHVVPRGVEHRPVANGACEIVLIEAAGTLNTGDAPEGQTSTTGEWLQ